ncbi:hypothetical protein EWB00_010829 [Schistosoma japonicum]|uniref:DUF5641 domain-containing protein n=1 Tax=Schistosoma japonicum TaxID=6182 RepID=A0A4Z2DNM7_SCHJA|nr:hypothetical protein EWB00_010829 [Schistosoma japonicum]
MLIYRGISFEEAPMSKTSKNSQPVDLVLVNDVDALRSLWSKAIAKQVDDGPDERVRMVRLKTEIDETTQDVRNLYPSEEADYLKREVEDRGRGGRFEGKRKLNKQFTYREIH